MLAVLIFVLGSGIGVGLYFLTKSPLEIPLVNTIVEKDTSSEIAAYSPLTGLELDNPSLATAPSFCVQIPNGLDGARPQVGLSDAGVIFEAIAEAGITRFAAIFQNPTSSVIGPIRSLRIYYLNWDVPFDCTVVHAGGAENALRALASGGYRDLTENYTYMWRGSSSNSALTRLWNNLFTSSNYLLEFNKNYNSPASNIQGFARLTPDESTKSRIDDLATNPLDIDTATADSVQTLTPKVTQISLAFGSYSGFNPTYVYNSTTNTYDRSYSGDPHLAYSCPDGVGEVTPELSCGDPAQLSPSVVIAMVVNETKDSDGVHEKIDNIGSGKAYIFQNGTVIEGTWEKPSREAQITFKNSAGEPVSLAPGQTWLSAIPTYGSISYE